MGGWLVVLFWWLSILFGDVFSWLWGTMDVDIFSMHEVEILLLKFDCFNTRIKFVWK